MNINVKKRNSGLEALRIYAMFLIVAWHIVFHGLNNPKSLWIISAKPI